MKISGVILKHASVLFPIGPFVKFLTWFWLTGVFSGHHKLFAVPNIYDTCSALIILADTATEINSDLF